MEFPHELRLGGCTVDAAAVGAQLYRLFAVVVHVGSGPNHGHYICLVKAAAGWVTFDDDVVERVEAGVLPSYYGAGAPADAADAEAVAAGSGSAPATPRRGGEAGSAQGSKKPLSPKS